MLYRRGDAQEVKCDHDFNESVCIVDADFIDDRILVNGSKIYKV